MKMAAFLLGTFGGLLAGAVVFLGWAITFGQIGVRVESYGLLGFGAVPIGVAGGTAVLWGPRFAVSFMALSAGMLVALSALLLRWGLLLASERDAGLASLSLLNAVLLLLPVIMLAIAAVLAQRYRASVAQAK